MRSAIVAALAELIETHGWRPRFEAALESAAAQDVPSIAAIRTVDDYLAYIDDMVRWAPRESGDSRLVHDKMVEFHFLLDQPSLRALQSPIEPGAHETPSPLSRWMRDYAIAWGAYLDTPESVVHVDTFRTNPAFRWDDYLAPPSGFRTFNQFFARHVKPGRRPVAAIGDDAIVVAPADAVFIGAWPIADDATIDVEPATVDAKGLRWSIEELLAGSAYAHRFAGGTFMHVALRTFDYHRVHTPVAGTVREARVVQGRVWLDVEAIPGVVDAVATNVLHAIEGTGYQFAQTRGVVVIESPRGLVACLPIGMGQVSSVVLTAGVGASLHKGEELGYFQFGGSDVVLVFERACGLALDVRVDAHALQGEAIGRMR